jgi:DMSO/TMAO reductase YedYZ molybdopterin-dependent catalytic subunit
MKHKTVIFIVLLFLLSSALIACGGQQSVAEDATLIVVAGESETSYTRADLEALSPSSVEAEGNDYVGVALADLLRDAGVDPEQLSKVIAVASDDFSADYEADLFLSPQTIVAYGADGGDLPGDEQPFRMVVPDQPGRMNVRMLARIEVSP